MSPLPRTLPAGGRAALALAAGLLLVPAAPASAQIVVGTGVDVQQLRPGPGRSDLLGVRGSDVGPHLGWHLGALWHLAHDPLVLVQDATNDRVALVGDTHTLDLLGSLSLFDRLELGVALPVVLSQDGEVTPLVQLDDAPSAEGRGLGDLRLSARIGLVGHGPGFRLAVAADLSLPTGDETRFRGESKVTATPLVLLGWQARQGFRVEVNAGVRFRAPRQVLNLDLGDELVLGAALEAPFDLGSQRLALIGTLTGSVNLEDSQSAGRPMEALGALSWRPVKGFAVLAGGGAGLTEGYGAAIWRVFAGVRVNHLSDVPFEAAGPRCRFGPEDMDGWEDGDGCADPDNDGDGVSDADDLCPNEAETRNGWRDADGCPDDLDDAIVPSTPVEGVPEEPADPAAATRDTDGDGVPDATDACPTVKEDPDGFEDTDGCPDPDNDLDGIPDDKDRCPLAAEVINGIKDDDGCPDKGKSQVQVTGDRVVILDKVYFASGKDVIQRRSYRLLDQVAAVLAATPAITKVRIEGHTDNIGVPDRNLDLSRRRARAVREYLLRRGVEGARLEAEGYGDTRPVADNKTARGRESNRRVEFVILEMAGQPVKPAGSGGQQQ